MCVTYNLKHYTLQLIQNYNELHFLGLFPLDMITKTVRGVCIGHFTTCNLKLTETFMCFFPPSAWKSCDYTVSWEDLIVLKDAFERWGKKSISIFEKSAHNDANSLWIFETTGGLNVLCNYILLPYRPACNALYPPATHYPTPTIQWHTLSIQPLTHTQTTFSGSTVYAGSSEFFQSKSLLAMDERMTIFNIAKELSYTLLKK